MKRVLVTGAGGFIGRQALPLLRQKQFEIYALTSRSRKEEGIHWMECDLLRSHSLQQLCAEIKPTHLLHLAWVTEHGHFWKSLENIDWVKFSIALVQAFVKAGGERVVCAGTCAEYDWTKGEPLEENALCTPSTLYGISKLAFQQLLSAYAREAPFSQSWGRIFYLYGPHEAPTRFIPALIRGLLQKKEIPCSHGNQIRDFLYVQDVAHALVSLLDSNVQGPVNIASGIGVTLKEVIGQIAEILGHHDLVKYNALPSPSDDPPSLVASTNRLQTELGWYPKRTLKEGLQETIHWWKAVS